MNKKQGADCIQNCDVLNIMDFTSMTCTVQGWLPGVYLSVIFHAFLSDGKNFL